MRWSVEECIVQKKNKAGKMLDKDGAYE